MEDRPVVSTGRRWVAGSTHHSVAGVVVERAVVVCSTEQFGPAIIVGTAEQFGTAIIVDTAKFVDTAEFVGPAE